MAATQYPDGMTAQQLVDEVTSTARDMRLHTFIEFLDEAGNTRQLEVLNVVRREISPGSNFPDICVLTGVLQP